MKDFNIDICFWGHDLFTLTWPCLHWCQGHLVPGELWRQVRGRNPAWHRGYHSDSQSRMPPAVWAARSLSCWRILGYVQFSKPSKKEIWNSHCTQCINYTTLVFITSETKWRLSVQLIQLRAQHLCIFAIKIKIKHKHVSYIHEIFFPLQQVELHYYSNMGMPDDSK